MRPELGAIGGLLGGFPFERPLSPLSPQIEHRALRAAIREPIYRAFHNEELVV